MALITIPRFFPQPWAANELMTPLTPEEMAIGYPSGTSEKPSRQSINGVLQYAINGVLYYLTTGVPAWVLDAEYSVGSIVVFGGGYFYSTTDANIGQTPDALVGWERLPWRRSDLDALYMTQAQADARFLSPESGDLRYYTQVAANALFLTQANAAVQFVTKAALEANFLTKEQAEALFLTQAQADQRYALRSNVVSRASLNETLADYETRASADATFITAEQAEERFMTVEDADAIFETQAAARATFLPLEDAGLRIYRRNQVYSMGALVLDTATSIIYVSVVNDNMGNSLSNPEFWRSWLSTAPVDINGLFLHNIVFGSRGDFVVEADDIPILFDHLDGIFLKLVVKGSGGNGGTSSTDIAHGGGEGFTFELIFQRVKKTMFPLNISIAGRTQVQFNYDPETAEGALTITAEPGENGTSLSPGAGGPSGGIYNYWWEGENNLISTIPIIGANGKWGTSALRGGDGGGVHGGSGGLSGTAVFTDGMRGCGGGGSATPGWQAPAGGPGYVQIYW